MEKFWRVMRWALVGGLIAGLGSLAWYVFWLWNLLFGQHGTGDIQGWARFGVVMNSLGLGAVGALVGAICGIVQMRRTTKER